MSSWRELRGRARPADLWTPLAEPSVDCLRLLTSSERLLRACRVRGTMRTMVRNPEDTAELRKSRGAFFTPVEIADLLSGWAVRASDDRVLEPSCGDAVILTSAARRLMDLGAGFALREQLVGVDLHEQSLNLAESSLRQHSVDGDLVVGDFFDFVPADPRKFDVVIGNPPYVRYQDFSGDSRLKARQAALAQGVRLDGLASSWAAFVVHATSFLSEAGRLALVLPAELLSVNYAGPVRRFLMDRFETVRLVMFEELVFPGVLEEVVLLLAEGKGPTDRCELLQARNLANLSEIRPRIWHPRPKEGKWMSALLPDDVGATYSGLCSSEAFTTLDQWGSTTLGMVTGRNRYFALRSEEVQSLSLVERDLLRIAPPGSRHLRGLAFTLKAWEEVRSAGGAVYLFDPKLPLSSAAQSYIGVGESDGIHRAYKCRVRGPWWTVPKVPAPDLFLTYMNHEAPRIVANRARVQYLNSVHGIFASPGLKRLAQDLLPIATLNSLTLLGAEVVGRSYGGGMLKLEPTEADVLPVPTPELLTRCASSLRALRPQLSEHLRQGDLTGASKIVDRELFVRTRLLSTRSIDLLRQGRAHLFERRKSRGRT